QPELVWARPRGQHAASWIVNLASALAKREDVDLRIITASAGIRRNQSVTVDGIAFYVVRHSFPFTLRGFPNYMRLDLLSRYAFLRRQIRNIILQLKPDLIHVHGTESGYGLAALDTKLPTIVSIQGIITLCREVSPSISFRLQSPIELDVIRRARYFGSRTAWANNFIRSLNKRATIYDLPEAVNEVFFETLPAQSTQNILMVGSILQRKGIEEAIAAMGIVVAACPSAKLLVVGDGTRDYLERLK